MIRLALIAAGVVVLLMTAAWGLQRRLIYFPSDEPVLAAATIIPGARDVTLTTSDGLKLGAWYVPPGGPGSGMTVLVANGNAGDRAGRAPLARALAERGLAVLLFDYRGYSGNPSHPSEEGLARDVRAALSHLIDGLGVDADRLIYFGESIGAAVVTELAMQHQPAAMLLRSPFTSLASAGRAHYPYLPLQALLRDRYPVAKEIAQIKAPVAVVMGTADSVVPASQSREVAAAAPNLSELIVLNGADHNDPVLSQGDAVIDAVVDLADQVASAD